jgi:hypothetical protein
MRNEDAGLLQAFRHCFRRPAAQFGVLYEHEHLLLNAALLHLQTVISSADDLECNKVLRPRAEASLACEFPYQGVQAFWWPENFFSRVAGTLGCCLSGGNQGDAARLTCGGRFHSLDVRFCLLTFGSARLKRRIAKQNELRKRLQIDRVLHLLPQNELLPSLQAGTSERCAIERTDQEILRELVGRTVSLRRSVGDRGAAEKADGASI